MPETFETAMTDFHQMEMQVEGSVATGITANPVPMVGETVEVMDLQSETQGAVGGVGVPSTSTDPCTVDQGVQMDPIAKSYTDMTSSDNPEIAVKEEYRTTAKRAR